MAFNRVLIKRAFKSTFRNRLFTILMFFLVLCSGGTYAAFESASSSFSRSYDTLVNQGALHDLVIKENFKLSAAEAVEVNQIQSAPDVYAPLTVQNLQNLATPLTSSNRTYQVRVATSLAYSNYGFSERPQQSIIFNLVNNDWNAALQNVLLQAAELQSITVRRIESYQANAYVAGLQTLYPQQLSIAQRQSIEIAAGIRAWKVINYDQAATVNKLITYSGIGQLSQPRSTADLRAELMAILTANNNNQAPPASAYLINDLKGYRISATNALQQVTSVSDPSALEAIVSPSYMNSTNKVPISRGAFQALVNGGWKAYTSLPGATSIFDALADPAFRATFANNIVEVDATPYFILGTGVTPDFAYPVVGFNSPTVDVANQAIVYVNSRGYERITDSFRTNARENYLSLRFASNLNQQERSALFNELDAIVRRPGTPLSNGNVLPLNMPLTPSTRMLTWANDPNDALTLTYERTAFLAGLSTTLQTVTTVTTSLLAVFVAVIIVMVFNVLIRSSRKSLATLLVLGYTRGAIALSTAFISFLVGALPAIIGYAIGWGAQRWFSDAFASFWTIPTFDTSFSWLSLVITVGLPTVFMFILIGVVVWTSLFHPIPKMLSDSVWDGSVFIARLVRLVRVLPIRVKYATALMLRNTTRLLLVSIATTSAAIALLVGMSTIGSGNAAYAETVSVNNYEYKVDLYSPTREGGQYGRVNYGQDLSADSPGWGYQNALTQTTVPFSETYAANAPSALRQGPHWHVIDVNDAQLTLPSAATNVVAGLNSNFSPADVAFYLKNKLQVKNLIDKSVAGINPWATVRQLMPENQQNQATENVLALSNSYQELIQSRQLDITNAEDYVRQLLARQVPVRNSKFDVVAPLYQPYIISYDNVVTNSDDETYTYLNVAFDLPGGERTQRVVGLTPKTKMINLGESENLLNNYRGAYFPIVVNKYISQTLGWNVGQVVVGKIQNHLDRNRNNFSAPQVNFEVVGIMDGYNNAPFVTTKSRANAALGMNDAGFNGVFSKHATSSLLSSLPLYSPSGFYLPTDTIVPGSPWASMLNTLLNNDQIWTPDQRANLARDVPSFLNKYSSSTIVPLLNNVDWQEASRKAFESVSLLSSTLINTIQGVSLLLSIMFTVIVASLIVRTNRKRIATLWALGYRRFEVLRIFSLQFGLSLGVALAISIPVSFGVLAILRGFIVNFGQILIPFSFAPWAPLVVIAVLALIFVGATAISILTLSPKHALAAFKED